LIQPIFDGITKWTELKREGRGKLLNGINKIELILKTGNFASANPLTHINPIQNSPAFHSVYSVIPPKILP